MMMKMKMRWEVHLGLAAGRASCQLRYLPGVQAGVQQHVQAEGESLYQRRTLQSPAVLHAGSEQHVLFTWTAFRWSVCSSKTTT